MSIREESLHEVSERYAMQAVVRDRDTLSRARQKGLCITNSPQSRPSVLDGLDKSAICAGWLGHVSLLV